MLPETAGSVSREIVAPCAEASVNLRKHFIDWNGLETLHGARMLAVRGENPAVSVFESGSFRSNAFRLAARASIA